MSFAGDVLQKRRVEILIVPKNPPRSPAGRRGAPDVTIPDVFERWIYSSAQTLIITVSNESIGARNSRRSKRV